VIGPGTPVVLYCRVSGRAQDDSGTLDRDERFLRAFVAERGAVVVGVAALVASGFDPDSPVRRNRPARDNLGRAACLARAVNGVVLAAETDRFVRHPGYHSAEWFDAQARESDLDELERAAGGAVLATVLDPDAGAATSRRHQSERGTTEYAVPDPRRVFRDRLMPRVWAAHEMGMSYRAISALLKSRRWGAVGYTTIRNWVDSIRNGEWRGMNWGMDGDATGIGTGGMDGDAP
jgi:hypothetical protein